MRQVSAIVSRLALATVVALVLGAAGCNDATTQAARVTIVALGGVTRVIHATHQDVYTRALDALRAAEHDGGSLADYNARVAPLRAEFLRRGQAIQALDRALYAAAGIIDAAHQGAAATTIGPAAALTLAALREALDVLRDGVLLAPIAIPREVDTVVAALTSLAGTFLPAATDGGTPDEH